MKTKNYAWFLAVLIAFSSLAIPSIAQACYRCCSGGLIYNSENGRFYSVPGTEGGPCVIYRSVDGKYYPVARYGCYCYRHYYKYHHRYYYRYYCYDHVVRIECQERPGHWFVGHWYPASNECWYVVRRY